jgi:flagellar biosynthesis protein FlhF
MTPDTYTYRGRSLEELVPRIRTELGDDAVIVARRETTSGGVGGFFAKREIEVEVRPGHPQPEPAAEAFARQLAEAQQRQQQAGGADVVVPRPATAPEIDALPGSADVSVDDLFPAPPAPQAEGLAALFNAGLQQSAPVAPETPVEPPPAVEAAPEPPVADVDQPTGVFDYLGITEGSDPYPEQRAEDLSLPDGRGLTPFVREAEIVLPAEARAAAEQMAGRGLRPGLAEAVAEEAIASLLPLSPGAAPKDLVIDALARRIPVHPLRRGPGVVGFVGPGGAGKTRCAARLAAAHARHGALPVTVVALRAPDGGAELTRLLAPYDVELITADSGAEGAARIASLRGAGLVVVDTPGVSPRSPGELRALGDELRSLAPDELHLTVSATIGPDAARELVGGVRELGVGAVAVTHTDETEILGTVIGLAIDCGLPLSYLARGQAIDAGLRPASPLELASDLIP